MDAALSPYDLMAHNIASMAALQLADVVVTLLPAPLEGTSTRHIEQAMMSAPRFHHVMLEWRWTQLLWERGVLIPGFESETPFADVRSVCEQLPTDPRFSSISTMLRQDMFESTETYLKSMCTDLLQGGVSPSVSLGVSVGLERFAVRHGLFTIRSESSSISDRLERSLERAVCSIAIPILKSADDEAILFVRDELGASRQALGAAIRHLMDAWPDRPDRAGIDAHIEYGLRPAAERYANDFRSLIAESSDLRAMPGRPVMLALSISQIPADASLRAGAAAANMLAGSAKTRAEGHSTAGSGSFPATLDVLGIRVRELPWSVN